VRGENDNRPSSASLELQGEKNLLKERIVPPPSSRLAFLAHPRLRRATSLAQHAVGAALEAIGPDAAQISSGKLRLGIIAGVLSGCINYSRRFYEEVLREPGMASPLIFPETVFNSPASHLAAFLGANGIYYTMVGDNGAFLQSLALATQWLEADRVDACVVIGMEESDWITADALKLFQRKAIHASGAGAVYLTRNPAGAIAELTAITDSFSFTYDQSRAEAAKKMRAELPPASSHEQLCDSTQNLARLDAAENAAWQDWPSPRISPKTILGEAFVASAAWQCVIACDALARGTLPAAQVSVVGVNQQAIGARFVKVNN
jgi:3-oxoacyl-(acyl-carrier-protein) synthase